MNIFNKERTLTPSWDLLGPSFDLLKTHILPLLYLSILPQLVITLGILLLPHKFDHTLTSREITGCVVAGAGLILSLVVYPGFIYFVSRTAQGKEVSTLEAFKVGIKRFFPVVGLNILTVFLTVIGFLLFIVPGLILFRSFYFAPYYLLDQGLGPIEALKKSREDSKPVSAWVWGTIGVIAVLSIAAGFISIIPILGTIAGLVITYSYIYGPALRYSEVAGLKTVDLKRK